MSLSRRAPIRLGRTACAVLACGAISGAALAAGSGGPTSGTKSAAAAFELPSAVAPRLAPTAPAGLPEAPPLPYKGVALGGDAEASLAVAAVPAVPIPAVPIPAVPIPAVPIPAVPIPAVPIPAVPMPAVPVPTATTPADVVVPSPARQMLPTTSAPTPTPTPGLAEASQAVATPAPATHPGPQTLQAADELPLQLRPETAQDAAAPSADPATAPRGSGSRAPLAWFIALLGGLLAIAAVVFQGKRGASRAGARDASIEVASTVRLGGRWQVSLVRVPGRMLVLGATDKGVSLLTELDDVPGQGDLELGDLDLGHLGLGALDTDTDTETNGPPAGTGARAGRHAQAPAASRRTADSDVLAALAAGSTAAPRDAGQATTGTGQYGRPRPLGVSLEPVGGGPAPATAHARAAVGSQTSRSATAGDQSAPSDAFLDHFLERLSNARPTVVRSTRPADERAELTRKVASYGRGPTRL